MKHTFLSFLFLIALAGRVWAQEFTPSVAFQTGFRFDALATFEFSPGNRWLGGTNGAGEYIVWDVQTGKQLQHYNTWSNSIPEFNYLPVTAFSHNDRYLLLPVYPDGLFQLHDLVGPDYVVTFRPRDGEWFTNAMFTADNQYILLIAERGGPQRNCELNIYKLNGDLVRRAKLDLPPFTVPGQDLMKLLMHRAFKALENGLYVRCAAIDDHMTQLALSLIDGKTLVLRLDPAAYEYPEASFRPVTGLPFATPIERLAFYKNKLLAASESKFYYTDKTNKRISSSDTLYVIDPYRPAVEKKQLSITSVPEQDKRSVGIKTMPQSVSASLNTFFESQVMPDGRYRITGKDLLTGRQVFAYAGGEPHFYFSNGNYHPGELNGGYIVALSDDRKYLAEYSLILLIHDVSGGNLQSAIPATRGQLKIAAPVFLDSARLFIPKFNNDGFVLDLRTGAVDHLRKTLDCQDTLHHGANTYYMYDSTEQLGIQNSEFRPEKDELVTTNIIPNSSCRAVPDREINVWKGGSLSKIASYAYPDREYVYTMSTIQGYPKKFLVNYKLLDFERPAQPAIKELLVVHKRDTFFVSNPVWLPSKKLIFGIAATRSKPGRPDYSFTFWDLGGKLIKEVLVSRPKTKMEFQCEVTKTQLSPDSSKLLYGLYVGKGGIFDLKTMSITYEFEHGGAYDNNYFHIHTHNNITSACFIDNGHFVTNGENGQIYLWTIGKKEPERVINKTFGYFLSLSLSPDKRYLIGLSFDKTLHFINVKTGEEDADFLASGPDAYTLINQYGFYLTGQRSVNDVSFFFKGSPYEFSQFDPAMDRPADVLRSLGYISANYSRELDAVRQKRLQKLKVNGNAAIGNYDVPVIHLRNLPNFLEKQPKSLITFQIDARDVEYKIVRLHVLVNGNTIFGSRGLSVKPANSFSMPLTAELTAGVNQIVVSAENDQGTESLRQSFDVTGPESATKPDLYVVAVGCATYLQKQNDLVYPVKDARDLVRLFQQQSAFYAHVIIDTFFDQNATAAKVMTARRLLLSTHPNDRVVVYFAGHGLQDKALNYYLSMYNTDFNQPDKNSLPFEQFERLVDSIPSRNKLVLIDACNSGEIDKADLNKTGASLSERMAQLERSNQLMQLYFSDLRRSNGAAEIGASGPFQEAAEQSELKNGVFTYFIKKAFAEKAADLNHDGLITASELADYLKDQVSNYTAKEQQPTLRHQNISSDVVVWQ